eukprot:419422-Amphidinium_carterae.1
MIAKFKSLGWTCFSKMFYSSNYVPPSGQESVFQKDIIEPVLGIEPNKQMVTLMRELYAQAYTE